ncbi:MAG: hypothetical protein HKL80_05580, partial [Acidimicrobiales bacterium]|nr:hypothetical protein [Acidimicrobiales bacterium]
MSCQVWLPTSWQNCAGAVAKSVAGDAFQSIAASFGQAAQSAVNWLWTQIDSATAVNLGGTAFNLELGIVMAITGVVAVGLFVLQVLKSALKREPGGLGRAVKGLFIAFIGGGLAIAVVNIMLSVTDQLSNGIVEMATGTNVVGLGHLLLDTTSLGAMSGSPGILLTLSLAVIAATAIVYAALVVRKVLLVITAVFAPLAFAGSLADVTTSWTRRWIETTAALIVSKLILVLIFLTGYGMLIDGVGQTNSGTTQHITQMVSGILVLALAGFSPWLALKVVHFTGDHAQQLHSLGTSAVGGIATGQRYAKKATPYVKTAVATAGGPGAVGASGISTSKNSGTNSLASGVSAPVAGLRAARGNNSGQAPSASGPSSTDVA